MQTPTPEMVEKMMLEKFGEVPGSIEAAKVVDPSFLVEQTMSAKMGTMSDKNALDPETTTMIFLAAALATGSDECIEVNTSALLKMGASKEEILSVVRIVRHAAFSKVVGDAKTVFDLLR